jgi:hypothetical protein
VSDWRRWHLVSRQMLDFRGSESVNKMLKVHQTSGIVVVYPNDVVNSRL